MAETSLKFKNMRNLGRAVSLQSGGIKEQTTSPYDPIYREYIQETGDISIEPLMEYARSIHTQDRFKKSLDKCDKPILERPTDLSWGLAGEFTKQMFDYQHGQAFTTIYDINMSTSVGKPYSSMGFKDKQSLLVDPIFTEELSRCHTPLWSVFAKDEYLPLEDLQNDKLRTIFNPELPFLIHQKFYFDEQNHRMKDHCNDFKNHWPRYGFVKQFGGFHDMIRCHVTAFLRALHLTIDVSGYDRDVVLKEVYEHRTHFLFPEKDIPGTATNVLYENFKDHYEFVVENTKFPTCVTPDGELFQRLSGNNSGSNNTTVDNCWSHTQITFHILIKLFLQAYNKFPTYQEIIDHVIFSIYGDDILGTLDEDFFFPQGFIQKDYEDFVRQCYKEVNLTVKEKAFKVSHSMEGLEFLGSTAHYSQKKKAWIPQARLGKLATSVSHCLKDKTPDIIASSLCALHDLVCLGESDSEIVVQVFLRNYTGWFLTRYREQIQNDFMKVKLMKIRDASDNPNVLVLGRETYHKESYGSKESLVTRCLSFSPDSLESRKEVGFKKHMMQFNTKKLNRKMAECSINAQTPQQNSVNPTIDTKINKNLSKIKSTYIMSEDDFCPPAWDLLPETVAFSKTMPGGSCFLGCNYVGFLNEYRQGAQSKGLQPLDLQPYEFQASGMSHIPTWECKATFTYSGKKYKTIQRSPDKKAAQQACARIVAFYVVFRSQKQITPTDSEITLEKFTEFWAVLQQSLKPLALFPPAHGLLQGSILGGYLQEDVSNVFEDIAAGKFVMFRDDPLYQIPPKRVKGWKKDLVTDGDVEGNPGPKTPSPRSEGRLKFLASRFYTYGPRSHTGYCSSDKPVRGSKLKDVKQWYPDLTVCGDVESNPGPQMLSQAQFLSKHKAKYDKLGLSKQQRLQRYKQHCAASTGQQSRVPRVKRAKVRRTQQRSGESVFNSSRNSVIRDQIYLPSPINTGSNRVVMSPCARVYAVALVNPFSYLDSINARMNRPMGFTEIPQELPCVPSFPSLKSRRHRFFSRGTFNVGNAGNGQIMFCPRRLANNYTTTSDTLPPLIIFSNPALDPGTTFTLLDNSGTLPAGFVGINTNSDYGTADVGNQFVTMRTVASGVRIRYAGADINRSGINNMVTVPGHQSLSGQTLTAISNYESYFRLPVEKKWAVLTYVPAVQAEYNYDTDISFGLGGENGIIQDSHYMGIMITGAFPGVLFEYETVHLMEVVGPFIRDLVPAESDIRALEMTTNALRPETQSQLNVDGVSRVLQNIIAGASGLTSIVSAAGRAATPALMDYAGRAAMKAIKYM